MEICALCEEQSKKTRSGKPHDYLSKIDDPRVFGGKAPRGYVEQDYHCLNCQAKFTYSTDKNDLPWTLWRA